MKAPKRAAHGATAQGGCSGSCPGGRHQARITGLDGQRRWSPLLSTMLMSMLLSLVTMAGHGSAQPCPAGRRRCITTKINRCIPVGTCCKSINCLIKNTVCPAPGGQCRCTTGFKLCRQACIREGTCCVSADCPLAGAVCNKSGGRCSCPAGYSPCAAAKPPACIRNTTCCTIGDCDLLGPDGSTCPGPGRQCQCPLGKKPCSYLSGSKLNNECISASTCCTSAECGANAYCKDGPEGQCLCLPGFKLCQTTFRGTKFRACIPEETCCTTPECLPGSCPGPGQQCTCQAGFKWCSASYGNGTYSSCISSQTCCTSADCGANTLCPLPGESCRRPWTDAVAWGSGSLGRLGFAQLASAYTPVLAGFYGDDGSSDVSLASVLDLSAGQDHTCMVLALQLEPEPLRHPVLASCWGRNDFGQLGDNSTLDAHVSDVAGKLVFRSISAGWRHTCGLAGQDSKAFCFGWNEYGQIGTGSLSNSTVPVPVLGTRSFKSLSAGDSHTCGLLYDTSIFCWGAGSFGQLGRGLRITAGSSPAAVVQRFGATTRVMTGFTAVSAGGSHTCALQTDGRAYCWGSGSYGQLGNGTTNDALTPVAVAGDLRFNQISAGAAHTCGILATNFSAVCWGNGGGGRLGHGGTDNSLTPRLVAGGVMYGADYAGLVPAIAPGGQHTCALRSDGAALCWGAVGTLPRYYGQIGTGYRSPGSAGSLTPAAVHTEARFTAIHARGSHSCGVTTPDRRGWTKALCWGSDEWSQLGSRGLLDSYVTRVPVPVEPSSITSYTPFQSVDAGPGPTSCAIRARDGAAICFGSYRSFSAFPVASSTVDLSSGRWVQLAMGKAHGCGIRDSGQAFCWGNPCLSGECGRVDRLMPGASSFAEPILGDMRFKQLSAGWEHTCGVAQSGDAACWGVATNGRLGNGASNGYSAAPRAVEGLRFEEVAAGSTFTCGVLVNGSLVCFGDNWHGILGVPATSRSFSTTPVVVSRRPISFGSITAGESHACALEYDGASPAWCWGTGRFGELGLGEGQKIALAPTKVLGGFRFIQISAGSHFTCGVTTELEGVCWGVWPGFLDESCALCGSTLPVRVPGSLQFRYISAGGTHALGLLRQQRV
ncbi:hypothetical protein ABPG77_007132 [Micractinium sp. CCAP 211/92]